MEERKYYDIVDEKEVTGAMDFPALMRKKICILSVPRGLCRVRDAEGMRDAEGIRRAGRRFMTTIPQPSGLVKRVRLRA